MGIPFTFEGTLTIGDCELPPWAAQIVADSEADFVFNFSTGAGTQSVDFGTISATGAKGVFILYETMVGAAPINLTFNDGSAPIELSQGGGMIYFSPVPTAGITSLSIAHTTVGKVRVWLLG